MYLFFVHNGGSVLVVNEFSVLVFRLSWVSIVAEGYWHSPTVLAVLEVTWVVSRGVFRAFLGGSLRAFPFLLYICMAEK